MALLQIENLNFTYPDADQRALNSISLSVDEGEFIVICGETGCGKTTLIRLLKPELAPVGEKDGLILYGGVSLDELTERRSATEIGYVMQNPDQQIVTDKVWHELAFGLENLGESSSVIRCRVGEMASYFGIQDWFRKPTGRAFRRAKAAFESCVGDGNAAESADSGRTDQSARPDCSVGLYHNVAQT